MHTVIVIAAQQDHRRKSIIETKLKLHSDIRKEMAALENRMRLSVTIYIP